MLLALLEEAEQRKRERDATSARKREDARWTSEDHPRGEEKRTGAAAEGYRNIGVEPTTRRNWREVDPQGRRKIRREKEDPARRARWPAPGGNGAAA